MGQRPQVQAPDDGRPQAATNPGNTGQMLILGAAVLWGTSGTAQALGPDAAAPVLIAIVRVGLGGIALLAAAALRGNLGGVPRYLRPVLALAGLAQAVFNASYFTALSMTGVAVGTMISVGSVPIFSGALGVLANREPADLRWYGATGMAVVGVVLLSGGAGTTIVDPFGVFFALVAGFSYSLFIFLSGRLVRTLPPDALIGTAFMVATVILLPFAAALPVAWAVTPQGAGLVFYMGLVSSGFAYMLYGRGLRTVLISRVGTLTLAEPLTGSMLGIFLLGEGLTVRSAIGMVLVFVAQVLIVARRSR